MKNEGYKFGDSEKRPTGSTEMYFLSQDLSPRLANVGLSVRTEHALCSGKGAKGQGIGDIVIPFWTEFITVFPWSWTTDHLADFSLVLRLCLSEMFDPSTEIQALGVFTPPLNSLTILPFTGEESEGHRSLVLHPAVPQHLGLLKSLKSCLQPWTMNIRIRRSLQTVPSQNLFHFTDFSKKHC